MDIFATVLKSQKIQIDDQFIYIKNYKIRYGKQINIPYDCIVVILHDEVLSGYHQINQQDIEKIQVLDIRQIYKQLRANINRGNQLNEGLQSKTDKETILIDQIQEMNHKIDQYESFIQNQITQYKVLQQRESGQSEIILKLKDQINQFGNDIQKQKEIITKQNNEMIETKNQFIQQNQQFSSLKQQLLSIYQEFQQIFGQQLFNGVFKQIKECLDQQNLQIYVLQQQIFSYKQDIVNLDEQIEQSDKRKKEAETKNKKQMREIEDKDKQLQDQTEILEKKQRQINQQLQEIEGLKRKIKLIEEEIYQKEQEQQKNGEYILTQQTNLNKQLKLQVQNLETQCKLLKQEVQELKNYQNMFIQKSNQLQKLQEDSDSIQVNLQDQIYKLTQKLKEKEMIIHRSQQFKMDQQQIQNYDEDVRKSYNFQQEEQNQQKLRHQQDQIQLESQLKQLRLIKKTDQVD